MDIGKVHEAIARFESIKTLDDAAYKMAFDTFGFVGKLPALADVFAPGRRMLRARVHQEPVLYTKIDAISTPPKRSLKNFGRFNKPYSPIFYCSEDRPTSYLELLHSWPDDSDHVSPLYATIGAWYTKVPLTFLIIPHPDIDERRSDFDKHFGAAIDAELSKDEKTKEAYTTYYRYLVGKLRQDDKFNKQHYIITTAYFDFVMQEADKRKGQKGYVQLDGMVYPSVKNRGLRLNYAIRPHLIRPENFELRAVLREAFRRKDKPPLIPDFTQIELMEATGVDQAKGDIHWDTTTNKIFQPTFYRYEKYFIVK